MSKRESPYNLPKQIERCLPSLSKLYAEGGERQHQEIIVNSQTRVVEAWSSDGWNGGTYGHALYLVGPEAIFFTAAKKRTAIRNQIKEDLNNIHNVQNEFVAEVFPEIEKDDNLEWRKDSGLLLVSRRNVPSAATKRIWDEEGFRVFRSE